MGCEHVCENETFAIQAAFEGAIDHTISMTLPLFSGWLSAETLMAQVLIQAQFYKSKEVHGLEDSFP